MPQVSNVYKSTKQKNQFDPGGVEEYSKNIKFRFTDYVRCLQHRLKKGGVSPVL